MAIGGCRQRSTFRSAWPEKELRTGIHRVADAESLRTALHRNAPPRAELLVDSGVKARYPGGSGFISVRGLYQEPDRIRLRGSRLDITLFDLLLRGDEVFLYLRDQGARYDGTFEELAAASGVIGGLSPRDLIASLLVLSRLGEVLGGSAPFVVSDEGRNLLVTARVGENSSQGIWLVRKEDGLVREFLLRDERGRSQIRVIYDRYTLQGDERQPMPRRLRLYLIPSATTFEVEVTEYRLAPALRPIQFEPMESRRIRPLRDLGQPREGSQ